MKRKAKAVKAPVSQQAAPRPLHLGLHGLNVKRHPADWHLESVPPPGLERQGAGGGVRALALAGGPNDEQRIEFGIAPLVPLKLPTPLATGPDGTATGKPPASKTPLPVPQVYMRYSW